MPEATRTSGSRATRTSGSSLRRIGLYMLAVVIVACAALFLIGRHQLGQAGRIRREADIKLGQATVYIASQGIDAALAAQREVSDRNWGSARKDIAKVTEGVRIMEQIAPGQMRSQIRHLKQKAADAEKALADDPDESLRSITDLLQSLQRVKERPLGD